MHTVKKIEIESFNNTIKRIFFELNVLISEELIRIILGYGGEIEILEPQNLKKTIAERVKQMERIYLKK